MLKFFVYISLILIHNYFYESDSKNDGHYFYWALLLMIWDFSAGRLGRHVDTLTLTERNGSLH